MGIAGPKIQMPSTLSAMFETGPNGEILSLKQEWGQFFNAVQGIIFAESRSGPSSSRPDSTMPFRYIGMPFYDTSLSTTINLASTNPDQWTGHYMTHKSTGQDFTTTTMTNDTELLIPLQKNEHYVGRIYADLGVALRATGVKVAITGPTGASATYMAGLVLDQTAAGNVDTQRASTIAQVLDFTTADIGNALNGMMDINFQITNSTTIGTMHVQFAQSTASTSPMRVRSESQLSAQKVQ